MELMLKGTTEMIIKAFYEVYNVLGFGFLEKVYQKALLIELQHLGLSCQSQKKINVFYKGNEVGEYFPDIIVDDSVVLELKAMESLAPEHEFQLINYLKSTKLRSDYY